MARDLLSNTLIQKQFLLVSTIIFFSCSGSDSVEEKMKKHYSEEMLQQFAKMSNQQQSRDSAIHFIDSLYNTFPYISVTDKYRYYDFNRELIERTRHGDRSYDTAISYADSMITIIEKDRLEKKMNMEYVKAFSIRSEYLTRLQRYNDAIRDAARCKQLNSEAGDSCLVAENTKTLSNIAIKQGNFPLAITFLKEAIFLSESCVNDKDQFVRLQRYLDDMGFLYWSIKKYDSSEIYHLAAANYVLKNKQLMGADTVFVLSALENIYGNLAYVYFKIKNYAEAEKYIKKTMLLTKTQGLAKMHTLLGKVYLANGKVNEAEAMAEKATVEIDNLEIESKSDLFELQSNIAKAKKQYEKAFAYQEQFRLGKDTINRKRIDLLKKNPFVEYEQLDKKYQVELLKKDNQNQQNKTAAAIIIGILLTLVAIISIYLIWRLRTVMKKRSVIYKKLVASEIELKETMLQKEIAEKQLRESELLTQEMQLQMKFNETIIEQRSQISDDMHDELSNSLAALKFYVEDERNKLSGTTAEKSLSAIVEEVSSVYQTARNYMHGLKTNNWETKLSLIEFLKEIRQKFSEKRLMTVNLNIEEEKIKSILTTFQHDQLYNICSEAITNIIKYSRASVINIDIKFEEFTCKFMIDDNGIGFNESLNMEYGLGLNSMRKRAADLAGILKIESSKSGTKIWGEFPV